LAAEQIAAPEATSPLVMTVHQCLQAAHAATGIDTSKGFYSLNGMSGKRYRYFINALIGALDDASYLEVGAWVGSTTCSAIHGNKVRATVIDDWRGRWEEWRWLFDANLEKYKTPDADVTVIKSDFRAVDYSSIGKFEVYMFDGPHEEKDQYDGVKIAQPALTDEYVLVVDDWNWNPVRVGTMTAIRDCGLRIEYVQEIRTTMDESHGALPGGKSDWHNGVCVFVLSKKS
jgi:hypothetical protein